ncbi:MAG: response regulator [Deltaproteobacteria bacterium]|nr:response regulator [Deltaproteobacteria bacterium]
MKKAFTRPALEVTGLRHPELVREVAHLVHRRTGIQLGQKQFDMIASRLMKRFIVLGLGGPDEYLAYLRENAHTETDALVTLITTHHTFFFREYTQFEYLASDFLPRYLPILRAAGRKTLRVWSAACSSGQEAYSLAMFLGHYLAANAPDVDYEIIGTDVDAESVELARNGVYAWNEIKEIPAHYLAGAWSRGNGDIAEFARIKNEFRGRCRFEVGSLFDARDPAGCAEFDLIFCRNVFIYFDVRQIKTVVSSLLRRLTPEGLLCTGLSESLTGLALPVRALGPSVFVKKASLVMAKTPKPKEGATAVARPEAPVPAARPINVLCVDDSITILTLLRRALTAEHGFNVVAVAKNGFEAAEALRKHAVDVMTLDIHMPEQGGLEYLERNYAAGHPPVLMLSSVSREDTELAVSCVRAGASDYVEKPSFATLLERGDELRTKLKTLVGNRASKVSSRDLAGFTAGFACAPDAASLETGLRIVCAAESDLPRLKAFWGAKPSIRVPTVACITGAGSLDRVARELGASAWPKVTVLDPTIAAFEERGLALASFGSGFQALRVRYRDRKVSILVFGEPDSAVVEAVRGWQGAQLVFEDCGKQYSKLADSALVVPVTSFLHHSDDFLRRK